MVEAVSVLDETTLKDADLYLAIAWGLHGLNSGQGLHFKNIQVVLQHMWSCSPLDHVLLRPKGMLLCWSLQEQIDVIQLQHTYPSCFILVEKAISPRCRGMRNVCAMFFQVRIHTYRWKNAIFCQTSCASLPDAHALRAGIIFRHYWTSFFEYLLKS